MAIQAQRINFLLNSIFFYHYLNLFWGFLKIKKNKIKDFSREEATATVRLPEMNSICVAREISVRLPAFQMLRMGITYIFVGYIS
jgi:hypothetical protein